LQHLTLPSPISIIFLVHTLGENTLDGSTIFLVQNNISIAILIETIFKKILDFKAKMSTTS
jgi:hypothetical protein